MKMRKGKMRNLRNADDDDDDDDDDAEEQGRVDKSGGEEKQGVDLQVEGLVELWRPIAGLLFCLELPLLIRKVRSWLERT